jgi:hypothetical protein
MYTFSHFHVIDFDLMMSMIFSWHHVLKGKFLEGRRNRRLDHLLHVLIDLVIPYYLLKERRQKLGFEGENLENQKRAKAIDRGKAIKVDDIKQRISESVEDESSIVTWLVKSASRLDHWYEVDDLAYTCTCPDYPIISFCKHMYAVQTHYPPIPSDISSVNTLLPSVDALLGISQEFPSASAVVNTLEAINVDTSSDLAVFPITTDNSEESTLCRMIAEKLERCAARIRQLGSVDSEQALRINSWLEPLDNELSRENMAGSLLPVKQKLSPHLNSWPETQAAMMPPKKTRAKKQGDKAYGAGESSGKKAKTLPKPVASVETSVVISAVVQAESNEAVHLEATNTSQPFSNYYRPKTRLY